MPLSNGLYAGAGAVLLTSKEFLVSPVPGKCYSHAGHSQRNILERYTARRTTRPSSAVAAAKARQTPAQECSAQQAAHTFHALHGIPREMGPDDGVAHQLVAMRMHLCSAAMDLHVQHRNAL